MSRIFSFYKNIWIFAQKILQFQLDIFVDFQTPWKGQLVHSLKHHCLTDFLKSYHFLTLARFSRIVTYLAKRDAIHIHSHVQALHVLPGEPPLWQSSPQRGKGYWPKGFLQLPSSNVSCGSLASTNHPLPSSNIYYFMKLRKLFPQ